MAIDIIKTAESVFEDNVNISQEEERGENLIEIIEMTIDDLRNDYRENDGKSMTEEELEKANMYNYSEEELVELKSHLQGKYKYQVINGYSYNFDTPKDVIRILEEAKVNKSKLRLDYGNTNKSDEDYGLSYGQEHNVEGPVEIGSGSVMDSRILAIHSSDGELLYKNEKYMPVINWDKAEVIIDKDHEYPFQIKGVQNQDGEEKIWVKFEKKSLAESYLAEKRKFEKQPQESSEKNSKESKITTIKKL